MSKIRITQSDINAMVLESLIRIMESSENGSEDAEKVSGELTFTVVDEKGTDIPASIHFTQKLNHIRRMARSLGGDIVYHTEKGGNVIKTISVYDYDTNRYVNKKVSYPSTIFHVIPTIEEIKVDGYKFLGTAFPSFIELRG